MLDIPLESAIIQVFLYSNKKNKPNRITNRNINTRKMWALDTVTSFPKLALIPSRSDSATETAKKARSHLSHLTEPFSQQERPITLSQPFLLSTRERLPEQIYEANSKGEAAPISTLGSRPIHLTAGHLGSSCSGSHKPPDDIEVKGEVIN